MAMLCPCKEWVLFKQSKVRVLNGCAWFLIQIKIDHVPAGIIFGIGAKFDRQPIETRTLGIGLTTPGGTALQVGADEILVALGDDDPRCSIALRVEAIEGFVNFKPNAIRVGMLPIPFVFPSPPVSSRLKMYQFACFRV